MFTIVKNNIAGEKKVIFFVGIFIFVSFSYLFYSEQKQTNSTGGSGGWAVYFENPKSQDLTFTIENNGKTKKIHWKELSQDNGAILKEGDVWLSAGQKKTVSLKGADISSGEKIIIEVLDENGEKKEIYKIAE